jgi:hypothetical protein
MHIDCDVELAPDAGPTSDATAALTTAAVIAHAVQRVPLPM